MPQHWLSLTGGYHFSVMFWRLDLKADTAAPPEWSFPCILVNCNPLASLLCQDEHKGIRQGKKKSYDLQASFILTEENAQVKQRKKSWTRQSMTGKLHCGYWQPCMILDTMSLQQCDKRQSEGKVKNLQYIMKEKCCTVPLIYSPTILQAQG